MIRILTYFYQFVKEQKMGTQGNRTTIYAIRH